MKTKVVFLFIILSVTNHSLNSQYSKYSNSAIIKEIKSFPLMKEAQYSITENGYHYKISYTLNELDITVFNRKGYLYLVQYLLSRPDFNWVRKYGSITKDYDFWGKGRMKNYKDVLIEVRMGCWDCTGETNELHSVRLILID